MELLMIEPHKEWWYKNGMKKTKDKMSDAGVDRTVTFDTQVAIDQHRNLVEVLSSVPWVETIVRNYPDESWNAIKWNGIALDDTTPYPRKYTFDNAVFTRDAFISNQKDKIILSNFTKDQRVQFETKLIHELLQSLQLDREIILWPNDVDTKYEWWDFRYLPKDNILIAWTDKHSGWIRKSRTTKKWVDFVMKNLWVLHKNLLIVHSKSFHVDCVVSVVTNDYWELIGLIAISENIHNFSDIEYFCKQKDLFLYDIWSEYWSDSFVSLTWGAINTLNYNEYLIGKSLFNEELEKKLESYGIKRVISDTSEFRKSAWSVHCLTNQI